MEAGVGEIRMFAGDYAPQKWAICDGSILQIEHNEELYYLIRNLYGGDGEKTFGLPDFRGRIPLHRTLRDDQFQFALADKGGKEKTQLRTEHLPNHNHQLQGTVLDGTTGTPTGMMPAKTESSVYTLDSTTRSTNLMNPGVVVPTGGNSPISNMQPYVAINFIICISN
jgi:microcystin-dependent protein